MATVRALKVYVDEDIEVSKDSSPSPSPPTFSPTSADDFTPVTPSFSSHHNDKQRASSVLPLPVLNSTANEFHFTELQDQLMETMMENEQLVAELKKLKDNQVTVLAQQLTEEKEKNRQLDKQLRNTPKLALRNRKLAKKREEILYKSKSMGELSNLDNETPVASASTGDLGRVVTASVSDAEEIDTAEVAEEAILHSELLARANREREFHLNRFLFRNIKYWLMAKFEELKDDFSEVETIIELPSKDDEGEPLNPFKLNRNLIRFGNVSDPIRDFIKEIAALSRWENPPVSLAVFIIYMVVVYKDWFISIALLMIASLFFFTYLRHKGWNFGQEVENMGRTMEVEKDLGLRNQISIIMLVGRRSMNDTGHAADTLEKIRNVLLWREPEVTRPIVMVLCVALSVSLVTPPYILVKFLGLSVGIHMFIIQYIFYRFPRIRQKYDKVTVFLKELKTDADFEKKMKFIKKEMRKTPKRSQSMIFTNSASNLNLNQSTTELNTAGDDAIPVGNFSFAETFQLPASEVPHPTWYNGRRCTLVNKDRSFSGFKAGKMYLTNNYICFERTRAPSVKNLLIPMETIKSVTKAKLYHWLPGGGKAIEIKLKAGSKAYIFVFQVNILGGLVNRDEAYQSIMEIGETNNFAWARTLPQDT